MLRHSPVVAWIVDDTGFPKKGSHSVGVNADELSRPLLAQSLMLLDIPEFTDRAPVARRGLEYRSFANPQP